MTPQTAQIQLVSQIDRDHWTVKFLDGPHQGKQGDYRIVTEKDQGAKLKVTVYQYDKYPEPTQNGYCGLLLTEGQPLPQFTPSVKTPERKRVLPPAEPKKDYKVVTAPQVVTAPKSVAPQTETPKTPTKPEPQQTESLWLYVDDKGKRTAHGPYKDEAQVAEARKQLVVTASQADGTGFQTPAPLRPFCAVVKAKTQKEALAQGDEAELERL